MHRDRWPVTPWGYPLTDLRPQGPPEAEVFTMDDCLLLLHVRGVAPHWLEVRMTIAGEWLVRIPDESESSYSTSD